jgi:hypothetical protein
VTEKDTEGFGVYCYEQRIFNSTFTNNKGNIALQTHETVAVISINQTTIHDGKMLNTESVDCSGVYAVFIDSSFNFSVVNCDFQGNEGGHLYVVTVLLSYSSTICIDKSTFNTSDDYGVGISGEHYLAVTIQRSSISQNNKSELFLTNVGHAKVEGCIFANNRHDGIELRNINYWGSKYGRLWSEISKTMFIGNSRAISTLWVAINDVTISGCIFTYHTGSDVVEINSRDMNTVVLEKSSFQRNGNMNGDCSVLSVDEGSNFTLRDVNNRDNHCTGIKLLYSTIILENSLNLTRNHGKNGGGITMLYSSKLIFTNTSKLRIIDNITDEYGGGVYAKVDQCFFLFKEGHLPNVFAFSGNSAVRGGD